jgi:hypothetical protein
MRHRHDEPNASQVSARYAAHKQAARRARDAAAGPSPCNRCASVRAPGSIFCAGHVAEYEALRRTGASADDCAEFCRRTYWPGVA